MDAAGRLTVPREVRDELHLGEKARFVVAYDKEGIVLRPVPGSRHKDAWAYTSGHRTLLARALGDVNAGRTTDVPPDR